MAVGGVRHEYIDPGVDQRGRPLPGVAEVTDRGADHQPAVGVLACVRELLRLHEVFDGDEPRQPARLVHQRESLALVLAEQQGGVLATDPDRRRDQRHRRHDLVHLRRHPFRDRCEPEVSVGDDAKQPVVGVHDGQARHPVLTASLVQLLQGGVGPDCHRVGHDAGLGSFDQVDLVGLVLDRQVAVQDAKSALPRHRDRHA